MPCPGTLSVLSAGSAATSTATATATSRLVLLLPLRRPGAVFSASRSTIAFPSRETSPFVNRDKPTAIARSITTSTSTTTRFPRRHLPHTHQHHHVVRRQYHSHDHPPPPGPFTPAESALLGAAYTHVAAQGFSREALALGARDAGLLDISPSLLLGGSDGGVFALIWWHLYTQRNALAGKAAALFASEIDGSPGGSKDATAATPSLGGIGGGIRTVSERVEMLAWARLQGNDEAGVVGRLQEALAVMAQPSYVPASLKELALLADEILYLAGDVSVDPSWYTKRASLSAIYAAAELFMTTDQSPGFRETRAFLRRRLNEAAEVGSAVRSAGEWLGFTASAAVNVLRSKGVRI